MMIEKVIVNNSSKETTDEQVLRMLAALEKQFNTGPIIGEVREPLLFALRNLMIRDMILESMGMNVHQREKIFFATEAAFDERDKKIIAERN